MPHAFSMANDRGQLAFESIGVTELEDSLFGIINECGGPFFDRTKVHFHEPIHSGGVGKVADLALSIMANYLEELEHYQKKIEETLADLLCDEDPTLRVEVHLILLGAPPMQSWPSTPYDRSPDPFP